MPAKKDREYFAGSRDQCRLFFGRSVVASGNWHLCVLCGLYYSAKPWQALAQLTSQVPLSLLTFPKRATPDSGERIPASFLEFSGLWAAGDCAAVPDGDGGAFHPPTEQHRLRQGLVGAKNIEAEILGHPPTPFVFKTLGQLATIGHRTGLAIVFGIKFSGFIAWCLWRMVYLLKLP